MARFSPHRRCRQAQPEPLIAAARALAMGDALGALQRVALRGDAPALALRGIALAQLGDFVRARRLLQQAARTFGPGDAMARARCVVAEAEIALAARDLAWPAGALAAACATLEAGAERANAAHARQLHVRHLLLTGHVEAAQAALAALDPSRLPPALRARHAMLAAGIALRRVQARAARVALARAERAARRADIPALSAEVAAAIQALDMPVARLILGGATRLLTLAGIEALFRSRTLVVDACRGVARDHRHAVALATRPIPFALLRALGESWPGDVPREALLARVFRLRAPDATHRARLRVEIARLRKLLRPLAEVHATRPGFRLAPRGARGVAVLVRPVESRHAALLALLADGEPWSSSALALALGSSQRSTQRALDALATAGQLEPQGRGRSRRWIAPPVAGFAATPLLPTPRATARLRRRAAGGENA